MAYDVDWHLLAQHERRQRAERGADVALLDERLAALAGSSAGGTVFRDLIDSAGDLAPIPPAQAEPEDLGSITAAWSAAGAAARPARPGYEDRVHAAWLARVIGNTLGKPIEEGYHWTRPVIESYLRSVDAYPLTDYVPAVSGHPLVGDWQHTTRGSIDGAKRDDDIDYTVLGLLLLEQHGADFTTADVAELWLRRLPYLATETAERVTYRNLVAGIPAEEAADVRNPYIELIGAQIRADIFGYALPGRPAEAAELAYRDARLSHRGNGVYGAMWAAALVAIAFSVDSVAEAVVQSLGHVPAGSRLHAELTTVVADHRGGRTWEESRAAAEARWAGTSWVHTVNNAGALTAALLWGGGDVRRTLALTVQAGLDTDSNGGTAGSVLGAVRGTSAIPAVWSVPIDDRVETSVVGIATPRISELADRTVAVARSIAG